MSNTRKKRPDVASKNRSRAVGFDNQFMPEPNSGCWLWLGAMTSAGYGHVCIGRKTMPAHRRSWEIRKGQIPCGMHVLHKCDNRMCVNPDHLFIGTNADNIADKVAKGRQKQKVIGEISPNAKLNELIVRSIKIDTRPNTVIGRELGVSNVLISLVKRGKAWRHVQ